MMLRVHDMGHGRVLDFLVSHMRVLDAVRLGNFVLHLLLGNGFRLVMWHGLEHGLVRLLYSDWFLVHKEFWSLVMLRG